MPPTSQLSRLTAPLVIAAALAGAGPAVAATTVGSTSLPSGATMPTSSCSTSQPTELVPYQAGSANSYAVPAGGGSVTSWSFNASGAKPGTPYTLVVVRPQGSSYQIIGTDPEQVPAGGATIATFPLAHPITVQGGDLIGAMVSPKSSVGCMFKGGSIPSSDVEGFSLAPATVGTSFSFTKTIAYELVNVSATVVQSNDVAITQTAEPSSIIAGDDGVFVLDVTSSGPSQTPVTVTDTLPSGLTPVSASAGTGTCSTSGQTVTCQLSGAPASIAVVASASTAGSFTNTATVTGTLFDPNTANNRSTAGVTVNPMPSAAGSGLTALTTPLLPLSFGRPGVSTGGSAVFA